MSHTISHRRSIVELAYYHGTRGQDPDGRIHTAVTEGRNSWYPSIGSTSCGDEIQCLAYAAGCRSKWVNRDEHEGWRAGENLSVYVTETDSRIKRPRLNQLTPGDFLIYDYSNGRAHGCVFIGMHGTLAVTVDAGQPGIQLHECEVTERGWGPLLLRGRPLDYAIDVDSLEWTEPPLTVAEWCASNDLPVLPWTPAEYLGGQWSV